MLYIIVGWNVLNMYKQSEITTDADKDSEGHKQDNLLKAPDWEGVTVEKVSG